jgi:hypothetical protein
MDAGRFDALARTFHCACCGRLVCHNNACKDP